MKTDLVRFQPSGVRSVFLYATNEGYLRYCTEQIIKRFPDFESIRVTQDELLNNPQLLISQADLFTPQGKGKVVVVESATDKSVEQTKSSIADVKEPVILVFPALVGASVRKLKMLHESDAGAAFIGCYLSNAREKQYYIDMLCRDAGVTLSREAMLAALQIIEDDNNTLGNDLQKAALLNPEGACDITLEELDSCLCNSFESDVMPLIMATLNKDRKAILKLTHDLMDAGIEMIYFLRIFSIHLQKLIGICAQILSGAGTNQAISSSRPPVFFKYQAATQKHLSIWQESNLRVMLQKLRESELRIKQGDVFDETQLSRVLLSLTSGATYNAKSQK